MTQRFHELEVADVMTAGVISCAPETPLRTVARLMAGYRVHAIFVLHEGDDPQLWGLVSDLDLVAAANADVEDRAAGENAVTPLVLVAADDQLEHAAQLMTEYGVSHLAVVDPETQQPVGVLSTLDIARAVAAERPRESRLLDLPR
jgi:CBS domain-containing protein